MNTGPNHSGAGRGTAEVPGPRALAVGPHHCRMGQEAHFELWAQRGGRPNHSEVWGPWQEKTTGKGQLRPSSQTNPASETKPTAFALIFLA